MSAYEITFAASARREFLDLPADVIERIRPKIRTLAHEPRPLGCKKLHGFKNHWRIRVDEYRIVYTINDTTRQVDITRIAHRREVYE